MARQVEFFFDYGSPYSYLANAKLAALRERTGAEVVFRPMLLGGVFKATGNQSPAMEPCEPKRSYGGTTLRRSMKRHDVPFQGNPHFPINTLPLMRAAIAAQRAGVFDAFHRAVYPAFWAEGQNLGDPDIVRSVLGKAGLDPEALFAASQDPEVKDRLRANTEEAVSRGAFGAPTFFLEDEMFFGADHMDFLEEALSEP